MENHSKLCDGCDIYNCVCKVCNKCNLLFCQCDNIIEILSEWECRVYEVKSTKNGDVCVILNKLEGHLSDFDYFPLGMFPVDKVNVGDIFYLRIQYETTTSGSKSRVWKIFLDRK